MYEQISIQTKNRRHFERKIVRRRDETNFLVNLFETRSSRSKVSRVRVEEHSRAENVEPEQFRSESIRHMA